MSTETTRVDEVVAALERGEEPRFMVRADTELLEFDTWGGPAPDPEWRFVDAKGHEHHYGDQANRWPTLRRVVDGTYWCEMCRDEHEEAHYECRICGEEIGPGMVQKPPQHITRLGLTTILLDDEPISAEDAQRIHDAINT